MGVLNLVINTNFTDTTLPLDYPDAVMTPRTLYLYDALDTTSYPPQADIGATNWINLMPGLDPAQIGATVGWSNGFTFADATSGSEQILLPASSKVAADLPGFVFTVWIKHTATGSGSCGIAGVADSTGTSQYAIWATTSGGVDTISMLANGTGTTVSFTATPGSIYQITIALKKATSSTYTATYYKNGVVISTQTISATSIKQPTDVGRIGRLGSSFSLQWQGTVYRTWMNSLNDSDDISSLVSSDYSINSSRFS
ncbi:hypothetical protein ML064_002311 [Klebsiella quasipneumoniae]|nr:hypothetical protein [Klebsiella quasipneumoniae]